MESAMRRAVRLAALTAAVAALGGCASWNDRYGHIRTDPVLWFLGGAPTEVQLDWPRREVPTLRPLVSPDLVSPKQPHPLDYPRGWSPEYPPYAPAGEPSPGATPDVDESRCPGACDTSPAPALGDRDGVDPRDDGPGRR
jgi:hypothetical protein